MSMFSYMEKSQPAFSGRQDCQHLPVHVGWGGERKRERWNHLRQQQQVSEHSHSGANTNAILFLSQSGLKAHNHASPKAGCISTRYRAWTTGYGLAHSRLRAGTCVCICLHFHELWWKIRASQETRLRIRSPLLCCYTVLPYAHRKHFPGLLCRTFCNFTCCHHTYLQASTSQEGRYKI